MSAYYNESDKFAAAWLRELIKAGLIADGEVDERDIRDVRADDLRGFIQAHFFAGIGGWSYALRLAGWPDDRPVWTGSCPCQPFSAAGRCAGAEDARHLWPVWFPLIRESQPAIVFGEQVAGADGLSWFDAVSSDLEDADYAVAAADLCAAGQGALHARQRLYFVATAPHADSGGRQGLRTQASRERGTNNNLRDWFKINFDLLYPPVACVRYLMGYPSEWDACADTATQSFPKSPRHLLRRAIAPEHEL